MVNGIKIDDVEYVRKDSIGNFAEKLDDMDFCVIRGYSSGVFVGYVKTKELKDGFYAVTLVNSIRLWQWYGASLSQISQEGTPDASKCKFGMTELTKEIPNVIEITPCTEKARINLLGVKQWKI